MITYTDFTVMKFYCIISYKNETWLDKIAPFITRHDSIELQTAENISFNVLNIRWNNAWLGQVQLQRKRLLILNISVEVIGGTPAPFYAGLRSIGTSVQVPEDISKGVFGLSICPLGVSKCESTSIVRLLSNKRAVLDRHQISPQNNYIK